MKRIESTQNAQVKAWKKLAQLRKERDKMGEYMIEGFHLVEEALKNKQNILHLIVTDGVDLPMLWDIDDIEMVEVTEPVAKELAETEKTQGVFAHMRQAQHTEIEMAGWKKLLLVDAVQDPGNLGTMIRTADAAGIDAVILGKGTADLYNAKTLRSAQGSHFHIPVVRGELNEWVDRLQDDNITVYGTALEHAVPFTEVKTDGTFALIVGNEGSGITPQILAKTDQNVIVPIKGQAESLNVAVATGILLYAFA